MKILCCSVFGLGNTLDRIPALQLLRRELPQAEITVLQDISGKGILDGYPGIRVVYFDTSTGLIPKEYISGDYDYVISFRPSNGWLSWTKNLTSNPVIGTFIPTSSSPEVSDWRANIDFVREITGTPYIVPPSPYFSPVVYSTAPKEPACGIHFGGKATWLFKRVPLHIWRPILEELSKYGVLVIFGQSDDFDYRSFGDRAYIKMLDGLNHVKINCDQKSVVETAQAMYRMCTYFVSTDSGLMHLAAAIGLPTVGLFGPTCVIKNSPRGNFKALFSTLPCSPCQFNWQVMTTCVHRKCFNSITPEAVIKALNL